MYTTDPKRKAEKRKQATVKAHRILLKLDDLDFGGKITFHFQKGEGIVKYSREEYYKLNGVDKNMH